MLGGSKTSRLYQRLVYQDKLADSVSVDIEQHVLASMFQLQVDVKKGVDPAKVEAAIADEWQKFLKDGPTADELARVKTEVRAVVRARPGAGRHAGARSWPRASCIPDDPGQYLKDFNVLMAATPASVKAGRRPVDRQGRLHAHRDSGQGRGHRHGQGRRTPRRAGQAGAGALAQGRLPHGRSPTWTAARACRRSSQFPDLTFPTLQHGKLANGIEVVLAERHAVPAVQMALQFDAGYAADQGRKLGTSSFTMGMLDEGTKDLDSIADRQAQAEPGRDDRHRLRAGCLHRLAQRAG